MWDGEAVRDIIGGVGVARHRVGGGPSEVVVQYVSQRPVVAESDIYKSLVEAGNRTAIHFVVLPVAAVHLDHRGLITIGVGIRGGAAECLGPVSRESLDMPGVEAVAECMADHVVGQHPTVPCVGKTAH